MEDGSGALFETMFMVSMRSTGSYLHLILAVCDGDGDGVDIDAGHDNVVVFEVKVYGEDDRDGGAVENDHRDPQGRRWAARPR